MADMAPPNIFVAVARFYPDIADQLVAGAKSALAGPGASVAVSDIPGPS